MSESVEKQISSFVGKYSPEIATQLRDARKRLRSLFPRGYELVFDNYNALVFGISPTENSRDAFVSIAGYPRWVTLFFLHGADLPDPGKLLQGSGKQVRSIRLKHPDEFDVPAVRELIERARDPYSASLDAAPALRTVLKLQIASPRPRRPAKKSGS